MRSFNTKDMKNRLYHLISQASIFVKVNSIIVLIQSHNHYPKPQVLICHPHTTLLNVCSKEATNLLSIDNSFKYHKHPTSHKNFEKRGEITLLGRRNCTKYISKKYLEVK